METNDYNSILSDEQNNAILKINETYIGEDRFLKLKSYMMTQYTFFKEINIDPSWFATHVFNLTRSK